MLAGPHHAIELAGRQPAGLSEAEVYCQRIANVVVQYLKPFQRYVIHLFENHINWEASTLQNKYALNANVS